MIKTIANSILHVFYPQYCIKCNSSFISNKQMLCNECLHQMPLTNFENIANNEIDKLFWGKLKVEHGFALGYFNRGGIFQNLVHQLKYSSNKDAGLILGNLMGEAILNNEFYKKLDVVIPLPLHPLKMAKRGFNQAEIIAQGIADKCNIPMLNKVAQRRVNTSTQTAKTRGERFENMRNVFFIKNMELLKNKHVLLVDDIITTGASLEACGAVILTAENTKLYIGAAAYSVK